MTPTQRRKRDNAVRGLKNLDRTRENVYVLRKAGPLRMYPTIPFFQGFCFVLKSGKMNVKVFGVMRLWGILIYFLFAFKLSSMNIDDLYI